MEKEVDISLMKEYELLKKKFLKYKTDISQNKEVQNVESFIKEHPFVSIGIALVLGAAIGKMFEKR